MFLPRSDVYNSRYAGLIILYICNGVMGPSRPASPRHRFRGRPADALLLPALPLAADACWQSFAYWTIGALSNDVRKLAYYAVRPPSLRPSDPVLHPDLLLHFPDVQGFYKGLQSAGAAIAFRIDSQKVRSHSVESLRGDKALTPLTCALFPLCRSRS